MTVRRQSVNMRAGPIDMGFGSRDQEQAYLAELERARAAQTVDLAVAPKRNLRLPSGELRPAGSEVTLADFAGGDRPGWRILEDHIWRQRVLERRGYTFKPGVPSGAEDEGEGPAAA